MNNDPAQVKNLPIQYRPTVVTTLVFLLLLGTCLFLLIGRNDADMQSMAISAVLPEYNTHISNFAISWLLVAGIGYMWLMLAVPFRIVLLLGAAVLLANWVYELFIPVLNVPDTLDAWYGTAGTVVGLVVLLLIKRYGLRLIKPDITLPEEA